MANKDPLLCLMKALQGFDTKVKKATAAAKQKQSDKKPNRVGLLGKIRGAVKKVGDSSFGQGVKAVGKFAKDVDSVLKVDPEAVEPGAWLTAV